MDTRGTLLVVRDVATLAVGVGGVIHEEFYTTVQRPALILLYGACLVGLATSKGRALLRALGALAADEEKGGDRPDDRGPELQINVGGRAERGPSSSNTPRTRGRRHS